MVSQYDSNVLYTASQYVMKSSDQGRSWNPISPDLTRNDKSKQQPSGGPITIDDTGTEYYDTIFAVAESPVTKGVIWAGTDDGLIQLTHDGGKTWSTQKIKVKPSNWMRVHLVDANTGFIVPEYGKVHRTKDGGKS